MYRKSWIFLGIVAGFILACAFALRSSTAANSSSPENSTPVSPADCTACCKEGDPTCTDAEKTKNAGDMLPESRSHQFIFILSPGY